jgi:hypothetical protein
VFLVGVSKVLDKALTCKTEVIIIPLSYELDIIASRHHVSTIFAGRPSSKGGTGSPQRMEDRVMEEILKAIVKGVFVKQGVSLGSKIVNNKRVTKSEEQAFWLSLLLLGLVNLPAQPPAPNMLARR